MANSIAAMSVCAACKHDPDCIWERTAESPVLQCEQFELEFLEPEAGIDAGHADAVSVAPQDLNGYVGLCSNCDKRTTCIYPKPEGGVWRCEEYE